MSDSVFVVTCPPGGERQQQSREWVIDQIGGGDAAYCEELAGKSDTELAELLQMEFDADPQFWEGRTVTVTAGDA